MRRRIEPRMRLSSLSFGTEHRVYTKEGRASRWRLSETPWAAEILNTLDEDSPYQRVFGPKGTQLGFTEIGLIWVGQGIVEGRSAFVMEPTEAVAKRVVKQKFRPMLNSTTILKGVFVGRAADSTLHFSNPEIDVMFSGANSASNFASFTVPRFMADEVDRWPVELSKEGHPLVLAANRIAEYGFLGKLFVPSSPTVEGVSLVWAGFLESDQRYFHVPCPKCGHEQTFEFDRLVGHANDNASIGMYCAANDCPATPSEAEWKTAWLNGRWIATCLTPVRADTAGFHLSSLYARLGQRSWQSILQDWEAILAAGSPADMVRSFRNTVLGLPYRETEDSLPVDELRERLETGHLRGRVPAGALLLTCGVDYQANRLEAFVWGWGPLRERWLVDKIVIARLDTNGKQRPSGDIRAELEAEVLNKDWPHELGGTLRVEMTLHDANDKPADVLDVMDKLPKRQNIAFNSDDGWGKAVRFEVPRTVDVKRDGKPVKFGKKIARVHSAPAKQDWYADLRRPLAEDGPSEGYVHLPAWILEEDRLLDQFVAEEIRITTRKRPQWVKVWQRNEALDCAVMARGAHWYLKADRFSQAQWDARRDAVTKAQDKPPPPTGGGNDEGSPQGPIRPAARGWINKPRGRWL